MTTYEIGYITMRAGETFASEWLIREATESSTEPVRQETTIGGITFTVTRYYAIMWPASAKGIAKLAASNYRVAATAIVREITGLDLHPAKMLMEWLEDNISL